MEARLCEFNALVITFLRRRLISAGFYRTIIVRFEGGGFSITTYPVLLFVLS